MISVLIADDHTIVRQGLKHILSNDSQLKVVGEATNGEEVLKMLETLKVDGVVLDITMPGKNGLDVLKELKRKYPQLPVLVLSMHPEDQFAIRVLKAGASGYVTKESAPDELIGALRKVCSGGKYVSPQLAEKLGLSAGYRLVLNCKEQAGQTVPHLHLHLLGGRAMTWPPG